MRNTGMAAILLTAIISLQAQAFAADVKQVEPFYPDKRQYPAYDAGRFVAPFDAVAVLEQGKVRERDFSQRISLDGDWRISGLENSKEPFGADADSAKGFEKASFDDSAWDVIKVPLNWYKKYPKAVDQTKPYVKGWYRKALEIPASAAGKRVIVHFDVVGYEATLFVNGKEAGSHHGDFTPWDADITSLVEPGKTATLALKVLSDFGPAFGVMAPAKHTYGSQWSIGNIKGGIWQHAELRVEPQVRVVEALVSPDLAKSSINVDCIVRNDGGAAKEAVLQAVVSPAETALAGKGAQSLKVSGVKLAPGDTKLSFTFKLDKPRLWSPEHPNLYNLSLPLFIDGKAVSATAVRFGYRSFKAEGDHFLLNGERIYLFGENAPSVRHGGEGVGEAAMKEIFAKYMLEFKSIGYNIVRNPHMPIVPVALEACDEVGMMLFDEWSWSFTKSLDPVEFERRNLKELSEWVKRDYNNACAVMWSCGNEVFYGDNKLTKDNLDKQVALVRQMDKSGRPVSSFSGAAHGYGAKRLETDVIDLHTYLGLGDRPWPFWEGFLEGVMTGLAKEYANADGKIDKPFIIWECIGFSWGSISDPNFVRDSIDDYIKYTRKPTKWGAPNGIGFAGSIGLASSLNKERGGKYGMATIGRRILEYVRQDTSVDGFAPWCHNSTIDMARLWNQPVYAGMRGEGAAPLRNAFAGERYTQSAFAVNSTVKDYEDVVFKAVLRELDGTEGVVATWKAGALKGWTKAVKDIELAIPSKGATPRWAQIRCVVAAKDGVEISRNFYDIFIASPVVAKVESAGEVGLLASGKDGESSVAGILEDMGVGFRKVAQAEDLKGLKTLIAPPSSEAPKLLAFDTVFAQALSSWVRNGGTFLVLEQGWRGEMGVLSRSLTPKQGVFADLAVSTHPAFKGLTQENFEFWNNPDHSQTASTLMSPVGIDLIAARGPMLAQRETFSILSDGALGQGRLISSQFDACKLWRKDSVATMYLRNLIASATSPVPKSIKSWVEFNDEIPVAKDAVMKSIDLRPYANMGFKDDVEGDGKGGWTDQGLNDFRTMPLGHRTFRNIAFDIADPASNKGKACIALRGEANGDIVPAVKGVKVGERFSRLFFLHSAAWIASTGTVVATYTVHYADGSTVAIPVVDGVSICDWWHCSSLPGAKLAFSCQNAQGQEVGLTLMDWTNPRPDVEIKSIDFASGDGNEIDFSGTGGKAMCVVVAVSGEKAPAKVVKISGAKWSVLAEGAGGNVASGPCVPTATPVPAEGSDAVQLSFPAKGQDSPKPVAFKRFPAAEKAKLADGAFRYLVVEIKAENDGALEIVLPREDWKDALRANVFLRGDGLWHTYWLRLAEDMKFDAKLWSLKDLRGEFFIFGDRKLERKPVKFIIRDISLQ